MLQLGKELTAEMLWLEMRADMKKCKCSSQENNVLDLVQLTI